MQTKRRTWLYVRVSAQDDAKEADRQARRLAAWVGALGLELERVFLDRSGLDNRRPERERMLALLADDRPPEVLAVASLARLWRPTEAVAGWHALAVRGVALLSEQDGIDTRSLEAASQVQSWLGALVRLASESRGERVALGIRLARTRKPGDLAAWGGGRVRRVLPLEQLAGWYREGASQREMRRRLARRGVRAGYRAIVRALDELWQAGLLSEDPARRRRRYQRGAAHGRGA